MLAAALLCCEAVRPRERRGQEGGREQVREPFCLSSLSPASPPALKWPPSMLTTRVLPNDRRGASLEPRDEAETHVVARARRSILCLTDGGESGRSKRRRRGVARLGGAQKVARSCHDIALDNPLLFLPGLATASTSSPSPCPTSQHTTTKETKSVRAPTRENRKPPSSVKMSPRATSTLAKFFPVEVRRRAGMTRTSGARALSRLEANTA